ncbi:hypothetical protein ABZS96_41505, partial [Streptomyces avermitilis]|uniref:hypothetical protein n=1 Tax=Streptomyces avermitilis TaxID=33903 RepID=UPI0033BF3AD3
MTPSDPNEIRDDNLRDSFSSFWTDGSHISEPSPEVEKDWQKELEKMWATERRERDARAEWSAAGASHADVESGRPKNSQVAGPRPPRP